MWWQGEWKEKEEKCMFPNKQWLYFKFKSLFND